MKTKYKVEVIKSAVDGQWRWRIKRKGNGAILAVSEQYVQKNSALRVARPLAKDLGAEYVINNKPEGDL